MNVKVAGKSRLSSEERRASIVEAACKLFSERGFRGTTTRELAAAVGVTEPVLYEHFKTKRDLYSAIIEAKSTEGLQILVGMAEQYLEADDDRGFFTRLGMLIVNWYIQDPSFVRLLLFSNLEGHELKDLFHASSERCFGTVAKFIERRIQQGVMREVDPAVAARSFFGMVAHYSLTGLLFGCSPLARPNEEVVDEMVNIFMGGMCKQERS